MIQLLIKLVQERHSFPAAEVLEELGAPEGVKALGNFYFIEMEKVERLFSKEDFLFANWEELPRGCVLREFLPRNLSKQISVADGNGIYLDYTQNYSDDCPNRSKGCKIFDIYDIGKILGKKASLPVGDKNLLLYGCTIKEDIAKEIKRISGKIP